MGFVIGFWGVAFGFRKSNGKKHKNIAMDDFLLIHEDKEYLIECRKKIEERLKELDLHLSVKKTQIFPITQPIHFLGFSFRLTETGKVVMRLLPEKISHERRKLRKLVNRAKEGYMTREQVDACFTSWKAHAEQGDTYNLVRKMTTFYQELWR